jgi:hypothetical protein
MSGKYICKKCNKELNDYNWCHSCHYSFTEDHTFQLIINDSGYTLYIKKKGFALFTGGSCHMVLLYKDDIYKFPKYIDKKIIGKDVIDIQIILDKVNKILVLL